MYKDQTRINEQDEITISSHTGLPLSEIKDLSPELKAFLLPSEEDKLHVNDLTNNNNNNNNNPSYELNFGEEKVRISEDNLFDAQFILPYISDYSNHPIDTLGESLDKKNELKNRIMDTYNTIKKNNPKINIDFLISEEFLGLIENEIDDMNDEPLNGYEDEITQIEDIIKYYVSSDKNTNKLAKDLEKLKQNYFKAQQTMNKNKNIFREIISEIKVKEVIYTLSKQVYDGIVEKFPAFEKQAKSIADDYSKELTKFSEFTTNTLANFVYETKEKINGDRLFIKGTKSKLADIAEAWSNEVWNNPEKELLMPITGRIISKKTEGNNSILMMYHVEDTNHINSDPELKERYQKAEKKHWELFKESVEYLASTNFAKKNNLSFEKLIINPRIKDMYNRSLENNLMSDQINKAVYNTNAFPSSISASNLEIWILNNDCNPKLKNEILKLSSDYERIRGKTQLRNKIKNILGNKDARIENIYDNQLRSGYDFDLIMPATKEEVIGAYDATNIEFCSVAHDYIDMFVSHKLKGSEIISNQSDLKDMNMQNRINVLESAFEKQYKLTSYLLMKNRETEAMQHLKLAKQYLNKINLVNNKKDKEIFIPYQNKNAA